MKQGMKTFGKTLLVAGASLILALPAFALLDYPAEADAEAETSTEAPVNYASLGLADRNSIQLDEGEVWWDNSIGNGAQAVRAVGEDPDLLACNSPFGSNNTQGNHFGLYDGGAWSTFFPTQGHASAFQFKWDGSKGAYSVGTYCFKWASPYDTGYSGLTYKWWNLTGKKKSNHTKIQTWTGDSRKNENLFWVSKRQVNEGYCEYRIWSALSGRPVGFKQGDTKNLQTLDNHEAGSYQYFTITYRSPIY